MAKVRGRKRGSSSDNIGQLINLRRAQSMGVGSGKGDAGMIIPPGEAHTIVGQTGPFAVSENGEGDMGKGKHTRRGMNGGEEFLARQTPEMKVRPAPKQEGEAMVDRPSAQVLAQAAGAASLIEKALPEFMRDASPQEGEAIKAHGEKTANAAMRKFKAGGHSYRQIGMDERVDVAAENARGETPKLVVLHNEIVEQFGMQEAMEYRNDAALEEDAQTGRRAAGHARTNIAQCLADSVPALRATLNQAKMFRFDAEMTYEMMMLAETDWREWMPRVRSPFPFCVFEFSHEPFQEALMTMENPPHHPDKAALAGLMYGTTGMLVISSMIVPLHKVFNTAAPMLTGMTIPQLGHSEMAKEFQIEVKNEFAPTIINPSWGVEYEAKYGRPGEDIMHPHLMVSGAQALMNWERLDPRIGKWCRAVNGAVLRRSLAALALLNDSAHPIEIASTGKRDGRTVILKGGSVPRYTMGLIRLKPAAPREVPAHPPELDPNREIVTRALHDVRGHFRHLDHQPNEQWEACTCHGRPRFHRWINDHEAGDIEKGDVRALRAYGVGSQVKLDAEGVPPVQDDPNRFAPSEQTMHEQGPMPDEPVTEPEPIATTQTVPRSMRKKKWKLSDWFARTFRGRK